MNHLRDTLRSLVIEALPHHSQTEVLRGAQSISEMIDQLEEETIRVQGYVDEFAQHFAPPSEQSAPAPVPHVFDTLTTEQEEDVKYAFAQGATIAELAQRYNVEKSTIFKLVAHPETPKSKREAELESANGNGASTSRRGRPPGSGRKGN